MFLTFPETDPEGGGRSKSKRVRTTFTEEQLHVLQANFLLDSNPDGQDLERIANLTGLSKRVTQVWFQNMRARHKKHLTSNNNNSSNNNNNNNNNNGSAPSTKTNRRSSSSTSNNPGIYIFFFKFSTSVGGIEWYTSLRRHLVIPVNVWFDELELLINVSKRYTYTGFVAHWFSSLYVAFVANNSSAGQLPETMMLENPSSKRMQLDSSMDSAGYSLQLLYSYSSMQTPGKSEIGLIRVKGTALHVRSLLFCCCR